MSAYTDLQSTGTKRPTYDHYYQIHWHNADAGIGSTSIQFRPPAANYEGKSPQRMQTTIPSISARRQQQLTRLQVEKEAGLTQLKRLQS